MKKVTVATFASGVPAAVAIGPANPARGTTAAVWPCQPGGPVAVYTQDGTSGAANPHIPSRTHPSLRRRDNRPR
jgi:hypothetical protein